MRITFVMALIDGSGGARTVGAYAAYLRSRGHVVNVVVPQQPAAPLRWRLHAAVDALMSGLRSEANPVDAFPAPVTLLGHRAPVEDRDVPDADVVIATWWRTAEWVVALSPSKGAKAYFIQGHEVWEGQPIERVRATYAMPMRKLVISSWLARIMQEEYGVGDAILVPNGVDIDRFQAGTRRRGERPTIGYMHGDANIKGTDLVREVVALVREKHPDLRVVSFGSHAPNAENPAPQGCEFHLRPEPGEIAEIYASCDAWLFASRSEGFGLPILESLACGTPVVGARVGAAEDLLNTGAGVVVSPEDAAAMARGVLGVLERPPADWEEMSRRGRTIAERNRIEDAAARFERALERVSGVALNAG